ncbi:MAG: MATE family efflux transporter [Candidatus Ventricola sp.]|nr:MATE family efflux transporter [Candidatus Ventricola sp.]
MKSMSAQERTEMMLNAPVSRVIPRLAIPTIISMLITSIYNMADTFFVSQLGTSASGAVGVIFSAMAIIQAVAFMIGMGSGTNVSQALGAGDEERARRFASTGFFTAFGVGVVLAVFGLSNIDWLVRFLGATETIAPYAKAYATYIFYATPLMMCSFVMNNLLRFEGLAMYGMVGITTGGLLNMALDPIFIFGLGLGTAGAAIATAISQCVSFLILLLMSNTRPDAISIHPRHFRPSLVTYGRILYNGFPSLGRQGIASISTILLNTAAGVYGDAAIAAMSIVSRFIMFINSSVIGFGQGFQPVCGFNYGAGRYSRVREAFWFCVKVATVILLVLAGVSMLFSRQIITVFRRDDAEVIRIGTLALRLQLATMPLWGFIVMGNMFTQSIGYGVRATLLSIARQGIFLIPALLILPRAFGLIGIQCAQPLSDVCTLVFTLVIITGVLRQLKNKPDRT